MCFNKPFFYLVCFGVLSLRMVLAVDIGTDTTINTNSTKRHIFTDDNVTLTNNADIIFGGGNNTILSNITARWDPTSSKYKLSEDDLESALCKIAENLVDEISTTPLKYIGIKGQISHLVLLQKNSLRNSLRSY